MITQAGADPITQPAPFNEKAVAVAKDVLARLDARKLNLRRSHYIQRPDCGVCGWLRAFGDTDLRGIVEEVENECTVCLLGACLLSKARLYDQVPVKDLVEGDVRRECVVPHLEDVFDRDSLDLMEMTFENGWVRGIIYTYWTEEYDQVKRRQAAQQVYQRYGHSAERLTRAVMNNVIANGGVYVPEQLLELKPVGV